MGRYSWLSSGSFRRISSAWGHTTASAPASGASPWPASGTTGQTAGNPGGLEYLLDDGKHPGLRVVISVGPDALLAGQPGLPVIGRAGESWPHQVNLVLALVGPEGSHQAEQRVLGGLRHGLDREARRRYWGSHVFCDVPKSRQGGGVRRWTGRWCTFRHDFFHIRDFPEAVPTRGQRLRIAGGRSVLDCMSPTNESRASQQTSKCSRAPRSLVLGEHDECRHNMVSNASGSMSLRYLPTTEQVNLVIVAKWA